MAFISKRGNVWCVRYRYTNELGESKEKRVSGFRTKEDAMAEAKRLEAKSNAGIDVNGDKQTCGYIMERWFDEHCIFLNASTRSKYSDGIDRLSKMEIYNMPVRRVTPSVLNAIIITLQEGTTTGRPIALRTAIALTESLRLSLSWAFQIGLIPTNPLACAKLPKTKKREQKILSEQDIDDLVKAIAHHPFRLPVLLALYGGLRREETAALQWEDVDYVRHCLLIRRAIARTSKGREILKDTKNQSSTRNVSMPKFIMDELKLAPKSSTRICVAPSGEPYRLDSYPQAMRRIVEKINADRKKENERIIAEAQKGSYPIPFDMLKNPMPLVTYHDLRHTHAAMLIRLGIQPKVIQERLGHSSIKMTMDLYGYLMPGMQESVADELDRKYTQHHGE